MNGCLLLVIDNIQTNFTVDVIYYLAVCFNHLYIYRMINQPTIPYGFVIFCHGFKGLFGGDRVLEFEKSTEQDTHDYFIHHFCQDNSGIRIYLVEKLKKFLHSKRLNA
ncbi:hypothetical protein RF11_12228 [Thelohanellus kitauei]|uniref:Uncharacterized protein n=1 Tax=Thelohanellus kitauei TaxID=669202 RepID=A0A0C2J173_THEKT|nr:hypothetical protein RF11_12228 [Thelohanellus kitauei]